MVAAGLGFLQLVAIGLQVRIARNQNRIIEHQNVIMAGQREAADAQTKYMLEGLQETRSSNQEAARSSAAMQSIATSMEVNARFVQQSIEFSRQIAETSQTAFHANNRALMTVRPIGMDGLQSSGRLLSDISNARIRITNVGAVDATFLRFHVSWLFTASLPVHNPAVHALDLDSEAAVVSPGLFEDRAIDDFAVAQETYRTFNDNAEAADSRLDRLPHAETLFLFGYVKFRDRIGLRRKYFCWMYNYYLRSFAPVEHPQYSYEE